MSPEMPEDTGMTPERWARLKELFREAMAMPPSERPAFVDRVRESDCEMASDLESLLSVTGSVPPIRRETFLRAFESGLDGDD